MKRLLCLLAALGAAGVAVGQTFPVIQKKALWRDQRGELRITEAAVEFQPQGEEKTHHWAYQDIQYFDRVSTKELILLTYEDAAWRLGRDRQYRFVLTEGELNDELFETISRRIGRPVTDRVVDDAPKEAVQLPVKHLHTFGGCEGELVFGDSTIFYVTDDAKDAREWKIDRDIDSVWTANRYQLEVHVFDNNRREFSQTRVYRFQLKEPLDPAQYRTLKLRLYDLRAEQRVIP